MSAFLSKIHFWLYNKIKSEEITLEKLLEYGKLKGINCDEIKKSGEEKYDEPCIGELEENIDHGNIHGWLQKRINSVEGRIAYTITELLRNGINIDELKEVYYKRGIDCRNSLGAKDNTLLEVYQRIFDFQIEGMPCDRIREVLKNDVDVFEWRIKECVHSSSFEEVQGDVKNYYELRTAWINGFISYADGDLEYFEKDGVNTLRKLK